MGSPAQLSGSSGQLPDSPSQVATRKRLVAGKRLEGGMTADREQEVRVCVFCSFVFVVGSLQAC